MNAMTIFRHFADFFVVSSRLRYSPYLSRMAQPTELNEQWNESPTEHEMVLLGHIKSREPYWEFFIFGRRLSEASGFIKMTLNFIE